MSTEYEPLIISASFSPNPAGVGSYTLLKVLCVDAALPEAPVSEDWRSGEREAREV